MIFGITPNLLTWALGTVDLMNGPATRCCAISAVRYSSTTSGCCNAPSKFFRADLSITGSWLNPIRKPWVKPEIKKVTSSLLGYSISRACHPWILSGVVTVAATEGTMTVSESPTKCLVHCASHVS